VAAAVVMPREEEGSRALVAYVTPEDLEPAALRASLRERLPDFMVPAYFVTLPALPVNPNGKVDRAALAKIIPRRESGAGGRPPRGPLEEAIAAAWSEILGIEQLGAQDRFFDLGGHSLLALRVLARMRDVAGVDVPLRVLFEAPTIEGLAAWIEAERRQAAAAPIVPVPRDRPLPLSFTQERLWLVDRLYPGTPLYNVPTVFRLHGPLAVPAFAAALTEIVRRHEVLRTRYATTEDGAPVQIIEPPLEIAVLVADLTALPGDLRLAEARRLAWEESLRPFDLQAVPLLRALLLRSFRTAGRRTFSRGSSASSTRPWPRAGPRRCRRCPCSTPTSRSGSAPTCEATRSPASWPGGWSVWPAHHRSWSCPPTGRVRPSRASQGRSAP
jgi:aryl carrier-like protein